MPPKPKFQEGEKVLCFHGPLLYEAKCVKSEVVKEKNIRYFIHYNGWNKNWDEWVPEPRVLKFNETSQQKQKEFMKAHASKARTMGGPGKKGRPPKADKEQREREREREEREKRNEREKAERAGTPTPDTPSSTTGGSSMRGKSRTNTPAPASTASAASSVTSEVTEQPKKKRARLEQTAEPIKVEPAEGEFMQKMEVKIKIPDDLKPWLVDDWDLVTKQKKLLQLPSRLTVAQILDDWVKVKASKPNFQNHDAIIEVTEGLKEYFNVMLGTHLLYKWERPQYGEILADHPDTPMCTIYGGIHLLRLFVKLGSMLAYTPLDSKNMATLCSHLQDLLKYFSKSCFNILSTNDYIVAPPEYHRKCL